MADELAQQLSGMALADEAPPPYTVTAASPSVATTTQASRNRAPRSAHRSRAKHRAYVVFVGKQAGVYTTWDACNSQVEGVSHSVQQGFPTVAVARAAFEMASARGLTLSCADGSLVLGVQIAAARVPAEDLVLCLAFMDDPASIAIAPPDHLWYVVFKGVQPGVYRTYVEVSLSCTGLANAKQCSFDTRDEALQAFTDSLERGEVYRLKRAL